MNASLLKLYGRWSASLRTRRAEWGKRALNVKRIPSGPTVVGGEFDVFLGTSKYWQPHNEHSEHKFRKLGSIVGQLVSATARDGILMLQF